MTPSKRQTNRARDDQDRPDKSFKRVQTSHSSLSLPPSETDPTTTQTISNEETMGINENESTLTETHSVQSLSHMETTKRPLDDDRDRSFKRIREYPEPKKDEGSPRDVITGSPAEVDDTESRDDLETSVYDDVEPKFRAFQVLVTLIVFHICRVLASDRVNVIPITFSELIVVVACGSQIHIQSRDELLMSKYGCICANVHIESGSLSDLCAILETFLESYIPSKRVHRLDNVGCSAKILRDKDFAHSLKDFLRTDDRGTKSVIKKYPCASKECFLKTLLDKIIFGIKT
ncbi:hypothetical protein BGZ65_011476, partial [Modicella reniformis]